MKRNKIIIASMFILFTLIIFGSVSGCNKPAEQATAKPAPVAEVTTEELSPVELPEVKEGLITFISGDVEVIGGGDTRYADIGDLLQESEVIRTDTSSYCEVQFGETAVVRIQENTEVLLKDVYLAKDEANVAVNMKSGSLLCKVQKLAGKEKFQIETSTAVCGVRGTEFAVKAAADSSTRLAVKEGAVAVLPANLNVEDLKQKAIEKGQDISAVLDKLTESAPLVKADQEMRIDEEAMEATNETARKIESAVEAITAEPEKAAAKLRELTAMVETRKAEIVKTIAPPEEISEPAKQEMAVMDKMELIALAKAPSAEQAAAPQVLKVSINVEPADADIIFDGDRGGIGSYSGLYPEGKIVSFAIKRQGYEDHALSFSVNSETAKLYKVKLAKKPEAPQVSTTESAASRKETVTVKTVPQDAAIYINDKESGIGSFSGSFDTGEKIAVRISKEGYNDEILDVSIEKGSKLDFNVSLKRQTEKVTITTVPADAGIYINDKQAGAGSYTNDYNVGEKLNVRISKNGFNDHTFTVIVEKGSKLDFDINLTIPKAPVTIRTVPADAAIYINNNRMGSGSYTGDFNVGEKLNLRVSEDGYNDERMTVTVEKDKKQEYSFNLTKTEIPRRITLRTTPADATIMLNYRETGKGSYSENHKEGEQLSFTVKRKGYGDETVKATVGSSDKNLTVILKPLPLEAEIKVSDKKLVGDLAAYGSIIYAADVSGKVAACNLDGIKLYEVRTANGNNENSFPVIIGGSVYFSGGNELVIIQALNGSLVGRRALEGGSSHMFGRRVVADGSSVIFPTDSSLDIISTSNGAVQKSIAIPATSKMTPAVWKGKYVIADQQGTLYILNPQSGTAEASIPTSAIQPVALAVAVYDDYAVFSGRKGPVVCVDLAGRKVLWEKKLPDASQTVFNDMALGPEGVFIFTRGTIIAASYAGGQDLYASLTGVNAAPLYANGKLYFGSGNQLMVRNAATSAVLSTVDAKAAISTRPINIQGKIAAGTANGTVVVMNP